MGYFHMDIKNSRQERLVVVANLSVVRKYNLDRRLDFG